MAFGTSVRFEPLREIAFGSVSGNYVSVGTPTSEHVRLVGFNNAMDQDIYLSFDGVKDHLRMAANSFILFDLSSNKIREDGLFLSVGTQLYIKEVSASVTTGSFWMHTLFADGGK